MVRKIYIRHTLVLTGAEEAKIYKCRRGQYWLLYRRRIFACCLDWTISQPGEKVAVGENKVAMIGCGGVSGIVHAPTIHPACRPGRLSIQPGRCQGPPWPGERDALLKGSGTTLMWLFWCACDFFSL